MVFNLRRGGVPKADSPSRSGKPGLHSKTLRHLFDMDESEVMTLGLIGDDSYLAALGSKLARSAATADHPGWPA
jgi:hypothetical protein